MTATLHSYKVPDVGFTPEQRRHYIHGYQQDAHVRRWYAEQRLLATDGITTEILLAVLLKRPAPSPEAIAIKAKCQALRDEALNNPLYTPHDYVRMCRFADKQEAKELRELEATR